MRHRFSKRFAREYAEAPLEIQRTFDRKLDLLLQDLRHPSLRAKKYDEAKDIWQARVTRAWRFYFQIHGDTYVVLSVRPHPK
jgi:mRNA-degrading endonuclease RelE of RelBE toxin-antitoxin system